jgi:uncharacterized protein (DUF952 family)
MSKVYHITTDAAWEQARSEGAYSAESLASEGFIHFSNREQVLWVAKRYYQGLPSLVLLEVDAERLLAELRYEESEPGMFFPHLYGPLNLDAVVAAHPFPPQADGSFMMPAGV